jgi:hypothetical protein
VIYELRIYTVKPGTLPAFIGLNSEVAWPIRQNNHGTLVGCWTSETGPLNRFYHMWSYPSLAERETLRAGLPKNPGWVENYTSKVGGMMVSQENMLLNLDSDIGLKPPGGRGHVYELRRYRGGANGGIPAWTKLFKEALPEREKYSKIVGLWTTEIGSLQVAAHLWAYDDLNQRAQVRAAALADPTWQAFVPKGSACLSEMETTIVIPTPISPMQ